MLDFTPAALLLLLSYPGQGLRVIRSYPSEAEGAAVMLAGENAIQVWSGDNWEQVGGDARLRKEGLEHDNLLIGSPEEEFPFEEELLMDAMFGEDLLMDAIRPPPRKEEPRKAYSGWWTGHPPRGRKRRTELPQCCEKFGLCAKSTEVPSYVGPAPENWTWEPVQLRVALAKRRVVLIGDSLTMQWSNALTCYLSGAEHWSGFNTPEWDVLEAEMETVGSGGHLESSAWHNLTSFKFQRLSLADVGAEIVTYVAHNFSPKRAEGFLALHGGHVKERADLVVVNIGVHFNDPDRSNSSSLQDDLVGLMETCVAEGLYCVLREPSAQHFWDHKAELQSGLYNNEPNHPCIGDRFLEGKPFSYNSKAEWRADAVKAALAEVGLDSHIMKVFDATMPLTFAHRGKGDCTHFLMETEFWEPWHASLFGLLQGLPRR